MAGLPRFEPNFDYGERRGDVTSSEWVGMVNRELFSIGQSAAADPLEITSGPLGIQISLNRATLDMRRFRLTSDWTDSSASAVNILYSTEEAKWNIDSNEFTVYDYFGTSKLKPGDTGLAKFYPDSGFWEIVPAPPGSGFDDDFFVAKVTSHTVVSTKNTYAWKEQEFLSLGANGTDKSGGRTGTASAWPAYELNNQVVADNTYIWMRRGFSADVATVTITQTSQGNTLAVSATWSLYLTNATGGTFTLTFDDVETTALAFDASGATIKAAIEATTSGLTLATVSGAGTSGSPYVIQVTSDASPHFLFADATGLKDGGDYRFDAANTQFATATQFGIVSSLTDATFGTQLFGGSKGTVGNWFITSDSTFDPSSPAAAAGEAYTGLHIGFIDFVLNITYAYSGKVDFTPANTTSRPGDNAGDAYFSVLATSSATGSTSVQVNGYMSSGNAVANVSGSGSPRFAVAGTQGASGSVSGMTVTGGIVTTLPAALTFTANADWAAAAPTTIEAALNRLATAIKNGTGLVTGP